MNLSEIAYKKLETHEEKMDLFNQVIEMNPELQELKALANKLKIRSKPDRFIPGSAWHKTKNVYINTHWMENLHHLLFTFFHEIGHIKQMVEERLVNTPAELDETGKLKKPPVLRYRAPDEAEFKEFTGKDMAVDTDEEYRDLPWEKEVNDFANKKLVELGLEPFDYLAWATRFQETRDELYEFSVPNILKRAATTYKTSRSRIAVSRQKDGSTIIVIRGPANEDVRGPDARPVPVQEQEIAKE